ncbi:single-stranded DNA-binding protein [Companilactobacillus allii]|uniref:Single-stranded DNA-binding protein n=1 Tax=Companilactobacillus allii TaxID=1847728 RepID=A0A1P8Q4V5_9LACO|nr:single-stranded DNA-binding protein [Companilactobacillus allii]APX72881.1 single-stranded DNA-binding protein [Companilactobacillus allii]USQ67669.1 single-stranded DNA-binding protein [Companilactobacillus allii]
MINRVVLTGRLTRDSELKYTSSGTAVTSFTVAVNRTFTNAQGEREADFINCVIWRKPAENFSNFTNKGSLVGIDGRLQTRSYENKQGQRVYITEVIVENFSFLESKSDSENRSGGSSNNNLSDSNKNNRNNNNPNQAPYNNQQNQSSQSPFGNTNNNQSNNSNNSNNMGNPFADKGKPINISDDDLPF